MVDAQSSATERRLLDNHGASLKCVSGDFHKGLLSASIEVGGNIVET